MTLLQTDPFDKRSPFRAIERARRKRLLIAISTGLVPTLTPIVIVFGLMLVNQSSWQIAVAGIITSLMIILGVVAKWQAKIDRIDRAGYILLISFLLIVAVNGLLIEGLWQAVAPSYVVLVVMAGMMLGVSGGFVIGFLAAIMWLSAQFLLSPYVPPAVLIDSPTLPVVAVVITVLDILFAAYMSYLATDDLHQALNDTTYELVRVNRQLEMASNEVQRAKERVEAILDNSPDAILLLRGAEGGIIGGNRSFSSMLGYELAATLDRSLTKLVDSAHVDRLNLALQDVIANQKTVSLEVVVRRADGTMFDAGLALAPIKGGELIKGMVCSIRDISQRVRAEEQIKTALIVKETTLAEREVLLKEIHHRVKNNLQVISSLLNLQSTAVHDDASRELFVESQNRVLSMALIHEQLYEASDLARINFSTYISNLTDSLAASYDGRRGNIRLEIAAEQVFLPIDTAIPCGLIINELVSNAFKHAFPNGNEGKIWVDFHSNGNGQVYLVTRDNGVGFPDNLDFRQTQSLGMQLVTSLVRQLKGNIELERGSGTAFRVTFELE